jgi:Fanconi-associated nuclease 1
MIFLTIRYTEAVELLKELLCIRYKSGRRGYWTVRLSTDLDHLGRKEESLQVAEAGVNDSCIRGGDRLALQRRVVRLSKPPRRWRRPSYAESLERKWEEIQIRGRPLNCTAGLKSRFYGYDGQQCGVEELALQYYASEEGGRWQGMHSEGGVWMTLFGLLMWDILFTDVPDVFQTPFQV